MDKIILNAKYAPGVPTYGTSGQDGKKGDNGRSLFFIPFNISNNKNEIIKLIDSSKLYNIDSSFIYDYSIGDSFVQPDGKIFQYKNKNKIEEIGSFIFTDKSFFEKDADNNFIYNSEQCNFLLTDGYIPSTEKSTEENNNSLFTIDSDNNNFIKLKNSNSELEISYDEDLNGFKISSNKSIYFDNLYVSDLSDSSNVDSNDNESENDVTNNNWQPIINDIDIDSSFFDSSNIKDPSTYYFEKYIYELNYSDSSGNYNKTIFNSESDIKVPNDISSGYFIITSKKYFVSKYYDISIDASSSI